MKPTAWAALLVVAGAIAAVAGPENVAFPSKYKNDSASYAPGSEIMRPRSSPPNRWMWKWGTSWCASLP